MMLCGCGGEICSRVGFGDWDQVVYIQFSDNWGVFHLSTGSVVVGVHSDGGVVCHFITRSVTVGGGFIHSRCGIC